MIFRRLTVEDASALSALHAEGFTTPWTEADFRTFLETPTYVCLGYEDQGQVLAFALFQVIPPEIEVCTLVVRKESRRSGLGKTFLRACLDGALKGEVCFLEVAENNHAALQLYASLGFKRHGIRPKYYKQPDSTYVSAIQMSKYL